MQNKYFFIRLLSALLAIMPIAASAQTEKLAEWNMESSADIAVTWFAQGLSLIHISEPTRLL